MKRVKLTLTQFLVRGFAQLEVFGGRIFYFAVMNCTGSTLHLCQSVYMQAP